MLVKVRRGRYERLNAIEEKPLKNFRNCIEIRNWSIAGRKRRMSTV
jgi:hypothetical protein